MDYFDRYKERVLRGATSTKDRLERDLERSFEHYLETSPTCKELYITQIDEFPDLDNISKELISINDITSNDKKALDEKYLRVRKDFNTDVGCYVFFDDCWWIIQFKDHKILNIYKTFTMRRCNQILKYKYKGILYEIPLSIENLTMYSDGMADIRYTSAGDSKRQCWYGNNPITRTLDVGTRIMLTNKTAYRATHINDFEYNGRYTGSSGLLKALVLQTALIDKDDLKNNIAWNPDATTDSEAINSEGVVGSDKIYIGGKKKYSIEYTGGVEWLLDNDYEFCDIVTQNKNECTLKANSSSRYVGCSLILIARDKNTKAVIDIKTIMIGGI